MCIFYSLSTHRSVRAREPDVLADSDIRERARGGRVEPRVQEAKHGFAGGDELVVDESDDARERRRGRGSTTNELRVAVDDDLEVPALCRSLARKIVVRISQI